jgi:hypothetical protein
MYCTPVLWMAVASALGILAVIGALGRWRSTRPFEHPLMRFTDNLGAELYLNLSHFGVSQCPLVVRIPTTVMGLSLYDPG